MQKVKSEVLNTALDIERILGQYTKQEKGPHLLVFAGIHGNEPSGVFALQQVFKKLQEAALPIRGTLTGIAGNLNALGAGVRYIDEDLNRMFLSSRVEQVNKPDAQLNAEEKELKAVTNLVRDVTQGKDADEIFFIDCHSTSSQSEPYISLNAGFPASYDFVKGIPVSTVAGVEREIKGCLSHYYNRQGYHGFTFEAGQNDGLHTIYNQEAMIWQSLLHAGCLQADDTPHIAIAEETLIRNTVEQHKFFSVASSYRIQEGEVFEMEPGYVNLQEVKKGQLLAHSNGNPLFAPDDGRILMPLYQKQGNFGYFFTREIDEMHLILDEVTQTR